MSAAPYQPERFQHCFLGKKKGGAKLNRSILRCSLECLVGGFNPFEKYYPGRDENKTCLKPPPRCRNKLASCFQRFNA